MRQVRLVAALQRIRNARKRLCALRDDGSCRQTEGLRDDVEVSPCGGLVNRDADGCVIRPEQVVPGRASPLDNSFGIAGHVHPERVKERVGGQRQPESPQGTSQRIRLRRDIGRDRAEPIRTVIHRIHCRHHGQ